MKEYLVFQLYSPLASWGVEAVGEIRHSAPVPDRSALLGLLAAAAGIQREEEARLADFHQAYSFAVHVLSRQTRWLRDYHTVSVPRENKKRLYLTRRDELSLAPDEVGTLISQREYRCDGYWHVAVAARADAPYSLAELRSALLTPHFPLYLGRKSCPPALPLAPQLLEGTLKQVLTQAAATLRPAELEDILQESGYCYWDDAGEESLNPQQKLYSYSQPLSRSRWQFGRYIRFAGQLEGGE